MGSPAGAWLIHQGPNIPLKKSDPSSPCSHQLPIVPQPEWRLVSPVLHSMLDVDLLVLALEKKIHFNTKTVIRDNEDHFITS